MCIPYGDSNTIHFQMAIQNKFIQCIVCPFLLTLHLMNQTPLSLLKSVYDPGSNRIYILTISSSISIHMRLSIHLQRYSMCRKPLSTSTKWSKSRSHLRYGHNSGRPYRIIVSFNGENVCEALWALWGEKKHINAKDLLSLSWILICLHTQRILESDSISFCISSQK